jgi:hypothetical protein
MLNWEDELNAWDAKYQPIQNHIDPKAGDKFETYGAELDYVLSINETEPARVWTLVEGDDGNLYITNGCHFVNRLNYFITANPCEWEYEETPYFIYEEDWDSIKEEEDETI